ncbi:MAG TPA: protein-glutamate O-methyltransferase CheR [Gemmatimonadales bacterium]|nr:protein-glutamate O-methyltransferase CheR [Gemmatimonadales bacterium]
MSVAPRPPQPPAPSDEEAAFAELARAISGIVGMTLDAYKDRCLRRRIAVRMRACGVHTYAEYRALLECTPAECERLHDALTINVTRFYRNLETWDQLRDRVLPDLLRARDGRLAVWSAGCASGEEPYTVALLVAEVAACLGRPDWLERLEVDATDIDRQSLERATQARYLAPALVELPPAYRARWFAEREGAWEVAERLRRRVRVGRLDLTREPPRRPAYDLILCRNVVIYFDKAMQERLFDLFAEALAPGGYLVLGKVETLLGPAREKLTLLDPRERIYRRPA